MTRVRLRRRAAGFLATIVLACPYPATAQSQAASSPPPSPATSQQLAVAASAPVQALSRSVAVDASGGPATLGSELASAIAAWSRVAPELVALTTDPQATSTIAYAPPALLGPDTLSLDLRVPGRAGVEIQLSASATGQHPMVLLHEVGVLLGLPEGGDGVMALAVPAAEEPRAPTASDIATLRAQRSYAREDLNHDGTVDFYDLVLFGQAYGSQGVNLPADFNGDGRVDHQDLAMLERAYSFTPPAANTATAVASTTATPGLPPSPPSSAGHRPAPSAPTTSEPNGAP